MDGVLHFVCILQVGTALVELASKHGTGRLIMVGPRVWKVAMEILCHRGALL
jgi:hypothetical protein